MSRSLPYRQVKRIHEGTPAYILRRGACALAPDGALTIVDYERGQNTVKAAPAEAIALLKDDKLHQRMKSFTPPLELPMMGRANNYDGGNWRIKEMMQMLANPTARQKLVRDI